MKIFETNIENGSLIDKISNSIGTLGTSAKLLRTEKGMVLAKDKITYTKKVKGQTPVSIIASFFLSTKSIDAYIVSWGSVSVNDKGLLLYASNGSTLIAIINYGAGIVFSGAAILKKNVWNNIAFTWNGLSGGIAKLYVNSVLINSQAITNSWTGDSTSPITLNSTAGLSSNIRISKIIVYDHILNQKEISNNYLDFVNSKRFKQKTAILQPNLSILKPTEIQDAGLVAAYNFKPINGKIPNVAFDNSTNGYNARQYDITNLGSTRPSNDGLLLQLPLYGKYNLGTLGTILNMGSVYTVEILLNSDFGGSGGNYLFSVPGYNTIRFVGNSIAHSVLVGGNSSGSSSFAFSGFTLTPFSTQHILIVRNGGIASLYLNGKLSSTTQGIGTNPIGAQYTISDIIGFNAGAYTLKTKLIQAKFFKGILKDAQYAKQSYNQFASKVVINEDFSEYPVGTTRMGNWGSKIKTLTLPGSFSIGEITSNIPKLSKGTKYMFCNTSGSCSYSYPLSVNYGTWSFILIKTNASANYFFEFCNDLNRIGYSLWWNIGTGTIKLYRGGTLAQSNRNYTTGYLNVVITRTPAGLFTVKINDTDIFSATDNVFNSCKSLNLVSTSAVGNGLANLKITQGISIA